jgi:hypothetical protein
MPNPWESLRRDQLIPVNKAVNKKEQLEKGWRRRRKKQEKCNEKLFVDRHRYIQEGPHATLSTLAFVLHSMARKKFVKQKPRVQNSNET